MSFNRALNGFLLVGFLASVITIPMGCGSGKPADGTHLEIQPMPPDEIQKTNDAFKDYQKSMRKKK